MNIKEDLLTKKHLAEKLQVSSRTIARYEQKGMPFIQFGGIHRYRYSDVLNWAANFKSVKGGEN